MSKGNFVFGFIIGAMVGAATILFANEDCEYIKVAKNKADDIKSDIGKATVQTKDQVKELATKALNKMETYKGQIEKQIDELKSAVDNVVDNIEDKTEKVVKAVKE